MFMLPASGLKVKDSFPCSPIGWDRSTFKMAFLGMTGSLSFPNEEMADPMIQKKNRLTSNKASSVPRQPPNTIFQKGFIS